MMRDCSWWWPEGRHAFQWRRSAAAGAAVLPSHTLTLVLRLFTPCPLPGASLSSASCWLVTQQPVRDKRPCALGGGLRAMADGLLDCSVCLSTLEEPCTLPCG